MYICILFILIFYYYHYYSLSQVLCLFIWCCCDKKRINKVYLISSYSKDILSGLPAATLNSVFCHHSGFSEMKAEVISAFLLQWYCQWISPSVSKEKSCDNLIVKQMISGVTTVHISTLVCVICYLAARGDSSMKRSQPLVIFGINSGP